MATSHTSTILSVRKEYALPSIRLVVETKMIGICIQNPNSVLILYWILLCNEMLSFGVVIMKLLSLLTIGVMFMCVCEFPPLEP